MNKNISLILGHHALLSITEVLSVLGNKASILHADRSFMQVEGKWKDQLLDSVKSLGGIIKIVEEHERVRQKDLYEAVETLLAKNLEGFEGKFHLSMSVYGKHRLYQKELLKRLKGIGREKGINIRLVHKDMDRNVAPIVLLKQRVLQKGMEIDVHDMADGTFSVGTTLWVHNPESIGKRDMQKPERDMYVGMMPPKVAMALLNIAFPGGSIKDSVMWDPYGGLGVIPIEALVMGGDAVCSDIEPAMIEAMETNLLWAKREFALTNAYAIFVQDARRIRDLPVLNERTPKAIVTEGYLGENFSTAPHLDDMNSAMGYVEKMHVRFFKALKHAEFKGDIVITLPYYPLKRSIRMTGLLGSIRRMGIDIIPLVSEENLEVLKGDYELLLPYTSDGTILYTRGSQFVGREVVKLRMS